MRAARLKPIAARSTSGVGHFVTLVAVGRVHSAQHLLEMIANESVVGLRYGISGGSRRPRDAGFDARTIAAPATANSAAARLIPIA